MTNISSQITFLIILSWSDEEVSLRINGREIPPVETGYEIVYLQMAEQKTAQGSLSFEHGDATVIREEWVLWRREKLSALDVPLGRIAKSLKDQVLELRFAIQRINELLENLRNGKDYWAGSLAVELRALLNWKDHEYESGWRGKYPQVPLLLRIAQF